MELLRRLGLVAHEVTLDEQRFGPPQQDGPLIVVPIFSPGGTGEYALPMSHLKLNRVAGYGNLELTNRAGGDGVAIVPLHMGYIQDGAQNHALCRSAFIGNGQTVMFKDACCVQQAQGGYLEGREQWFFVLPLALRGEALSLRGKEDYSKLWPAITRLNTRLGLESRGHLELILTRQRPFLTQYQSRFELLEGQTGALFLLDGQLAGLEIAPTPAFFAELWMPLVCFCYGVEAMVRERAGTDGATHPPFRGKTVGEVRAELQASRAELEERVQSVVAKLSPKQMSMREEERYLDMRLYTASSSHLNGQLVTDSGRVVYASLFALV